MHVLDSLRIFRWKILWFMTLSSKVITTIPSKNVNFVFSSYRDTDLGFKKWIQVTRSL